MHLHRRDWGIRELGGGETSIPSLVWIMRSRCAQLRLCRPRETVRRPAYEAANSRVTLDQFSGDGIMVFFNDPLPVPDPAERAVKMAILMRETANRLIATWRRRDRELGFGVGIAQGYATLGQIGFADRSGYTAIGTVCATSPRGSVPKPKTAKSSSPAELPRRSRKPLRWRTSARSC